MNAIDEVVGLVESLEQSIGMRDTEAIGQCREAIRAKLTELMPAWQPIGSAPKDGVLILVRENRCSGIAVQYCGGWKYESGSICYLEPTHWMPLPKEST